MAVRVKLVITAFGLAAIVGVIALGFSITTFRGKIYRAHTEHAIDTALHWSEKLSVLATQLGSINDDETLRHASERTEQEPVDRRERSV